MSAATEKLTGFIRKIEDFLKKRREARETFAEITGGLEEAVSVLREYGVKTVEDIGKIEDEMDKLKVMRALYVKWMNEIYQLEAKRGRLGRTRAAAEERRELTGKINQLKKQAESLKRIIEVQENLIKQGEKTEEQTQEETKTLKDLNEELDFRLSKLNYLVKTQREGFDSLEKQLSYLEETYNWYKKEASRCSESALEFGNNDSRVKKSIFTKTNRKGGKS